MDNPVGEKDKILYSMASGNHWKELVANELLYSASKDYLYAACSKNACSKIKHILAQIEHYPDRFNGDPHNRKSTLLMGPYALDDDQFRRAFFDQDVFRFAFVRNPFERIVSCYNNRVGVFGLEQYEDAAAAERGYHFRRKPIISWKTGKSISEVDPTTHISFQEFVEFVCEQDPFEMDRHWFHQTRSIQFDYLSFDKIGKIENFSEDIKEVLDRIGNPLEDIDLAPLNKSKTKQPLCELFDIGLELKFAEKFQEDFANFDYEPEIRRKVQYPVANRNIDDFSIAKNISIIIPTILRIDCIRRLVTSIRTVLGAEVEINVGWQGATTRYIREFCKEHECNLYEFPEDFGLAATRNELVKRSTKEFVLLCDDDFKFTNLTDLEGTLALLRQEPNLYVVGGLFDDITLNHKGETKRRTWIDYANYIYRDEGFLLFFPIEYAPHDRITWRHGYYTYCDCVHNFALIRKTLFTEKNIWWDPEIKITGEHEDFYLKIFDATDIDVAFYSGLYVEHHQSRNQAYNSFRNRDKWKSYWMKKWSVNHFLCFGKWHDFYDDKTNRAWRIPFNYLDCMERKGSIETFPEIQQNARRKSKYYRGAGANNEISFANVSKLFHSKDYEKACEIMQQLARANQSDPKYLRTLAEILIMLGRRKEALANLDDARKILPNNKRLKRRYLTIKFPVLALFLGDSTFQVP